MRLIGDFIFLMLFIVVLGVWFVAWAAFHVLQGGVHLLLLLALVFLVLHFFRGRSVA